MGPLLDGPVPHIGVAIEQGPPVTGFGGGGQISLTEGRHAVVGDALSGFGVADQGFNLFR